ncbi:protein-disulfide reductase DsbD [Thiopseudomonas alkaliphila]|uniref:protein-disulfide reductase DsbD n=1 Tax=Thiopseudomonas alkaliphila TaxID=1697053 RepID=UPI0009E2E07D|nr:protein-disulfide reductase DsbD [Thiopseudomonas alkaliphila]
MPRLLSWLLLFWLIPVQAFITNQDDFLPVEQAFQFELIQPDQGQPILAWKIADGYYLYQHKLGLIDDSGTAVELELPPGIPHSDEYFGDSEIYRNQLSINLPEAVEPPYEVRWQGCADAGLCYAPQELVIGGELSQTGAPALAEDQSIAATLADAGLLWNLVAFFGMGLLLAFTPCMLPMLPILTSVVGGAQRGGWSGARLGLAFVLPMALVYALLGVLAAKLGGNLQAALQQPWLLIPFAGIFIALALAQFGVYTLQLPAVIRDRLQTVDRKQKGGNMLGVAIMGALSALLVGPCMTAPLAGALLYIAQSGDGVTGGLALFALGLGSGTPLLLAISFGMRWMPKPGVWMENVNKTFGFALIAAAILITQPLYSDTLALGLWGAWLLSVAVFFSQVQATSKLYFIGRYLAFLLGIWSAAMIFGAAAGGYDPLRPLSGLTAGASVASAHQQQFLRTPSVDELKQQLAQAQQQEQWALVDFYADWCVSCKVMEREVFAKPEVQQALAGMRLLQIDVTDNTKAQQAYMQEISIMGPPTILFISPDGSEIRAQRITGEVNAEQFLAYLARAKGEA